MSDLGVRLVVKRNHDVVTVCDVCGDLHDEIAAEREIEVGRDQR